MYYYLHGIVTLHFDSSIVIECSSIGYDLLVAHVEDFPIGELQFVYVCYYSNENEQYLVGFKSLHEKELFLKLTSVKGLGPKTALNIFKVSTVDRIETAIKENDENYLISLPSIGRKTATQIILDLKGKLVSSSILNEKNVSLAYDGLIQLGFKDKEIKDALNKINNKNLTVEEYISLALKEMSK